MRAAARGCRCQGPRPHFRCRPPRLNRSARIAKKLFPIWMIQQIEAFDNANLSVQKPSLTRHCVGHGLLCTVKVEIWRQTYLPVCSLPAGQGVGVHERCQVQRKDGQAAQRAAMEADAFGKVTKRRRDDRTVQACWDLEGVLSDQQQLQVYQHRLRRAVRTHRLHSKARQSLSALACQAPCPASLQVTC